MLLSIDTDAGQFFVFPDNWNSTTCLYAPGFPCTKYLHPYLSNLPYATTLQTMLRHWLTEGWFMYSQNVLWD